MKKLVVIIATLAFAFAIAGCGSTTDNAGDDASGDGDATVEETSDIGSAAADDEDENGGTVEGEIAWSDSDDAAAAADSSGFSDGFTLPETPPVGDYEWSAPNFTSMDSVAEAHYDGGVVSVTVRKGEGVPLEELSADTSAYGFDWTQDCDGIEVTCHGYEDGVANFIEWESDGCSYDVWCMGTQGDTIGMTPDEVSAMVAGVK